MGSSLLDGVVEPQNLSHSLNGTRCVGHSPCQLSISLGRLTLQVDTDVIRPRVFRLRDPR